jgi:cell division protein FtsQ
MARIRGSSVGRAAVLTLLLVAAAAWAVTVKSPLFDVRDVRVLGAQRVHPGEIAELARAAKGSNLLLLGVEQIGTSILSNPWVSEVEVRRKLPSTLVVRIHERTPVGWVAGPRGGAIVAEDGTVLAKRPRRGGLVLIGRAESLPNPGARFIDGAEPLRVATSLTPRLRREVAAITDRGGGVVLRLRSGARVLYGKPDGLAAKRSALESILAWVQEERLEVAYVDLRAPGTPAVRARPSG